MNTSPAQIIIHTLFAVNWPAFDQAQLEYLLHTTEPVVTEILGETDQCRRLNIQIFRNDGDGLQGKLIGLIKSQPGNTLQMRAQRFEAIANSFA
jgi:hypothetical protein